MFSNVEGPFLERWRAWVGLERNEKSLHVRGMWETRTERSSWQGKTGSADKTDKDSQQDIVAKIARKAVADGKILWRRWQDGAEQIAGKAVVDGKKSGRGREERRGKNGEDNREEAGGGGRKKLMSMKIIG